MIDNQYDQVSVPTKGSRKMDLIPSPLPKPSGPDYNQHLWHQEAAGSVQSGLWSMSGRFQKFGNYS